MQDIFGHSVSQTAMMDYKTPVSYEIQFNIFPGFRAFANLLLYICDVSNAKALIRVMLNRHNNGRMVDLDE